MTEESCRYMYNESTFIRPCERKRFFNTVLGIYRHIQLTHISILIKINAVSCHVVSLHDIGCTTVDKTIRLNVSRSVRVSILAVDFLQHPTWVAFPAFDLVSKSFDTIAYVLHLCAGRAEVSLIRFLWSRRLSGRSRTLNDIPCVLNEFEL